MSRTTPTAQQRNQYGRDWGNYDDPSLLPNRPGFVSPTNTLDKLESGDTAYIKGAGRWYCESPGTPGVGDAVWYSGQVSFSYYELTRTAEADGQQVFFIEGYVAAFPGRAEVWLNGSLLTYGSDWDFQVRQRGSWPNGSTRDVSTGVWLANPTAAGDEVRIRWRVGVLAVPPPQISPAAGTTNALQPSPGVGSSTLWRYLTSTINAFWISALPPFQIELWRLSHKGGRVRGPSSVPGLTQYRRGRQFSPWYRLDLNLPQVVLPGSDFNNNREKSYFRACYYDPVTGARGPLSAELAIVNSGRKELITSLGVVHGQSEPWTTS